MWMGGHPGTTLLLGAALAYGSYKIGERDARQGPSVEKAVLLKEDLNNDGRCPDLAVQLLSGRREALYMQDDGSTFLSYPGMLKGYQEKEAILKNPLKSDKSTTPQLRPNPIDNPYVIPQSSLQKQTQPGQLAPREDNQQGPALNSPSNYKSGLESIAKSDAEPLAEMVPVNLRR